MAAARELGFPVVVKTAEPGGHVAFGPGGVLTELVGEATFRLAPLTDRDADVRVRVRATERERRLKAW